MVRSRMATLLLLALLSSMSGTATFKVPSVAQGTLQGEARPANVDFSGDGLDDLAIGVPGETVNGVFRAGAVQVLYGTPNGLRAAGNRLWSQNTTGVADRAEADDLFGLRIAAGDFDGDLFSDLAVSVPFEDLGVVSDAGMIHVLYGSPSGLQSSRSQTWSQQTGGVRGIAESLDMFGLSLAAGQLGRGSQVDLAIGAAGESIGSIARGGSVHVLYGSTSGLSATGSQVWTQDSRGVTGTAEEGDGFGYALAAGNVGKSRVNDLVIGVPEEDLGQVTDAGAVHVLHGSASGLTAGGSQFWTQDSSGIGGKAEAYDRFGGSLVAADFGRSGYADLAVGASQESVSNAHSAGQVHVIYGAAEGLSAIRSQVWSQKSGGVRGTPEQYDNFGFALAAGNFSGGPHADLAVGAPGEDPAGEDWWGAGAVQLLPGAAAGLSSAGSQLLTQDTPGIGEVAEPLDRFGTSLAGGNFNPDAYDDLAVGATEEVVEEKDHAGVVHTIPGTRAGLTGVNSQLWQQGESGLVGVVQPWDEFGYSLGAG